MESPFFGLASLVCSISGEVNTGYTKTHGFFTLLGAMIYCFLALLLIFRMTEKRFGVVVALLTTIIIFWGTNLIFYTLCEASSSHVYTFFLVTCLMWFTPKFYEKPGFKNSLILGVILALITIIRQTNLVAVLYIFLYGITSLKELSQRIFFWLRKWYVALLIATTVFLVFIPQFIYWHMVTGKWFIYTYGYNKYANEAFIYWNNPKIFQVLFGKVSGLFSYTPLMLMALAGMLWMLIQKTRESVATILLFLLTLYVIASWWCYSYDCGFGHRGFVDIYALLAIPMAFFISKVFSCRNFWIKAAFIPMVFFLIYINIRLSMMYHYGGCWNGPGWTWKHYRNVVHEAAKGGDFKGNYHTLD
jgi:hypothetical protein